MKRPLPVIVAQVVVAVLFLRTLSLAFGPRPNSSLRVLAIGTAAFLVFSFVALLRRSRDAHLLGACAVFLFVLLSSFSLNSRTLWSAFLRGETSTDFPAPYLNYSNRGEISAAVALEICTKAALLGVVAALIFSKRVRSFFATPKIGSA